MKILYLISHDPFVEDGITKKIISQTKSWKDIGHTVKIFNIYIQNVIPDKPNILDAEIFQRTKYYKMPDQLFENIKEFDSDVIYFRYEPYKPFLNKIFKRFITIVELNTKNISEQKSTAKLTLFNYFRFIYNKYTYNKALKYIDGIIGVTEEIITSSEISKLKIPKIGIPNSIVLSDYQIVKTADDHSKVANVFFMGSKEYLWNGLDKVLQLAARTLNKLIFHIVGMDKDEKEVLPNVHYYGFQKKDVYIKILQQCHVCIGSLAMHRISLYMGSTLKVLEYLAYGFPIIIGYHEFALMDIENREFIMELDNEEANVINNVNKIVDFCYTNIDRVVQHNEVYQFIDSNIIEKKRVDFFNRIRKSNVKN